MFEIIAQYTETSGLWVPMPQPKTAEFSVTCLRMNKSGEKYYDE